MFEYSKFDTLKYIHITMKILSVDFKFYKSSRNVLIQLININKLIFLYRIRC